MQILRKSDQMCGNWEIKAIISSLKLSQLSLIPKII